MTEGQKYIVDSLIEELEYDEAIKAAMIELRNMGITTVEQVNDLEETGCLYDEPVYPANAQLYDEFVDHAGFYLPDFMAFIARRIESENEY